MKLRKIIIFSAIVALAMICAEVSTRAGGITNSAADPFQEDFESYTNGFLLAAATNTSWEGQEDGVMVVHKSYPGTAFNSDYPISTTHSNVLELTDGNTGVVTRVTSPNGKNVWIDMILNAVQWDQTNAPAVPADTQVALYVSTNNHLVIYTEAPDSGVEKWVELTSRTVTTSDWSRVSIFIDYETEDFAAFAQYYQVYLNGIVVTSEQGYADNANIPFDYIPDGGSWFTVPDYSDLKLEALSWSGAGYIDDLVVTTGTVTFAELWQLLATIDDPAHGSVAPEGTFYVENNFQTNFSIAWSNFYAAEVVLNGTSLGQTNSVNVTVTNDTTLTVSITALTASNNVPLWWLNAHNDQWAASSDAADSNALANPDHDALLTWQEWLASTDPNDSNSVFEVIEQGIENGTNYIMWVSTGVDPALPAFAVLKSTNLVTGANGFVTNAMVARPSAAAGEFITNKWMEAGAASGTGFFRPGASNP
jgi:hypothetical protein